MAPRTRSTLVSPLASAPDLTGLRAVVTGGTGGIGLATTRALASRGATVIVGVRDLVRAGHVRQQLLADLALPQDRVQLAALDLIDPDSVRGFAATAGAAALDLLVLNAGISSVPFRQDRNGIESQFATNHLGHFALTGLLLPVLENADAARVVTVSSALYTSGRLTLGRLSDAGGYSPGRAYNDSKLANAIFAVELGRRLAAAGSGVRSFAAHPGMARTPLHSSYPSAVTRAITGLLARVIGREPDAAAVGILAAALSAEAEPQLFWGPTGAKTRPDAVGVPFVPRATDPADAAALWDASMRLTGVSYLS
jgi:NAD(P)-dependent dehydrogenase (short-subunit alcohol dehydrogenase family)